MNPLIVIQARVHSTRLPGKILMSIDGVPMVRRIYDRMKPIETTVVACAYRDRHVLRSAYAPDVPEDDVLARYFYASVFYDPVVRITADCPLIDPKVVRRAIAEYDGTSLVCSTRGPDYDTGYPDGQDVEVFPREMLEDAHVRADEREHVTAWMRENCLVKYLDHKAPVQCKLSVDTWEDLLFVREIVRDIGPDCTLEEIYHWVAARPEHKLTPSG